MPAVYQLEYGRILLRRMPEGNYTVAGMSATIAVKSEIGNGLGLDDLLKVLGNEAWQLVGQLGDREQPNLLFMRPK